MLIILQIIIHIAFQVNYITCMMIEKTFVRIIPKKYMIIIKKTSRLLFQLVSRISNI